MSSPDFSTSRLAEMIDAAYSPIFRKLVDSAKTISWQAAKEEDVGMVDDAKGLAAAQQELIQRAKEAGRMGGSMVLDQQIANGTAAMKLLADSKFVTGVETKIEQRVGPTLDELLAENTRLRQGMIVQQDELHALAQAVEARIGELTAQVQILQAQVDQAALEREEPEAFQAPAEPQFAGQVFDPAWLSQKWQDVGDPGGGAGPRGPHGQAGADSLSQGVLSDPALDEVLAQDPPTLTLDKLLAMRHALLDAAPVELKQIYVSRQDRDSLLRWMNYRRPMTSVMTDNPMALLIDGMEIKALPPQGLEQALEDAREDGARRMRDLIDYQIMRGTLPMSGYSLRPSISTR